MNTKVLEECMTQVKHDALCMLDLLEKDRFDVNRFRMRMEFLKSSVDTFSSALASYKERQLAGEIDGDEGERNEMSGKSAADAEAGMPIAQDSRSSVDLP